MAQPDTKLTQRHKDQPDGMVIKQREEKKPGLKLVNATAESFSRRVHAIKDREISEIRPLDLMDAV